MKIAVIFEGNIYQQRGEFVAIRNRIREIKKYNGVEVDVYVHMVYVGEVLNYFLNFNLGKLVPHTSIDGIKYHCIWIKKSILDYITKKFFKRGTNVEYRRLKKQIDLSKYDIVYAHSLKGGLLANEYKRKNAIPYVMLWHGSSIHSSPFKDRTCYQLTKDVLDNADVNLFVSHELLSIAQTISHNIGKVSYNGVDTDKYYAYDSATRIKIKNKFRSLAKYRVAFVGNCLPIKNVDFLPRLFHGIALELPETEFYIIGTGNFYKLFYNTNIKINYLDNVLNEDMPDIYNIMDLVVLPSVKEGLPMTCLEATSCGVPFVASRVGGIEDVIGSCNTIPWSASFEDDFINRCIEVLKKDDDVFTLSDKYKLSTIVKREIDIFEKIIIN